MKFSKIKSFAKINLTIKVLGKYKNGFHKIESLVSKISLSDEILIKEINSFKNKINFTGKFSKSIPESNTVSKLLNLLVDQNYIKNKKFQIIIKKNIPQFSGMGGGSMNAGSILNYFIKKKIIKVSKNELIKIAQSIGSDVILGLFNGPVIVFGKKKFKLLKKKIKFHLLIIKPSFGCSTKTIYSHHRGLTKGMFINKPIFKKDYLRNNLNNDLEITAFKKYPILQKIKNFMQKLDNIYFVNMTGTGSTIIGYFLTKNAALKAKKKLENKYKNYWCIYSKTI